MKKLLVVLLSILMVIGMVGCTKKTDGEPKNTLEKIQKQGYITVGIEGDWSPWCYTDEKGNLTGFEVELAKLVAAELGVEAKFEEAPFDSLLLGVGTRFDIICNGVGYTEKRAESMTFSDAYVYDKTVLIVLKENTTITSFEDLKGKKTGNSEGSTYAALGEKYGATVVTIDKFAETMIALEQGKIDATINSDSSLIDYLLQHPEAPVKIVANTDAQKVCWPVAKGETELIDAVNAALSKLRDSGKLSELSIQFFTMDITKN